MREHSDNVLWGCIEPKFNWLRNLEKIWKLGRNLDSILRFGDFGILERLGNLERIGKLEIDNMIIKRLPWYTTKVCQLLVYKYWSE